MSPALPRTLLAFALALALLTAWSPSRDSAATLSPATVSSSSAAVIVAPATARPVAPRVREFPVPPVSPALQATRPQTVALSTPRPSHGFGVVGATWRGAPPAGLGVEVRTRTGQRWSSWTALRVDPGEHGPDARSAEAGTARPGTDPLVVGNVDRVQMRATSPSGRAPRDLTLSVVNPGRSPADDDPVAVVRGSAPQPAAVVGQAPRPQIRSRAAWGANERLRTRRPTYGVVRAGFVHHTVSTTSYPRAAVPAMIRGVYAFHVRGRGWSDIGYNYLVDRFGRIWEGRFGGVARNVIGAHTLGYNHLAFAMSAIGNFQTARPSPAVLRAFGRLMAWKLGINGVAAGDLRQRLRGRVLRAISGHRDAGSTLCPGRHLYARIAVIRGIAVAAQRDGTPPEPPPEPPPEDGGPGPG